MCQDKDSSIDKEIAVHISKAELRIHPPLTASFFYLQEKRDPSLITVSWEDKCPKSKCPPFFLLPPAFYWVAWCQMEWDIPSVIWDQLSWLCPLTASYPSPVWSTMGQCEKRLWYCIIIAQHYLKTWVCSQHSCVINLKQHHVSYWRRLTLSLPKAVQVSVLGHFLSLIIVLQNNIHASFVQLGLSLSYIPLFF